MPFTRNANNNSKNSYRNKPSNYSFTSHDNTHKADTDEQMTLSDINITLDKLSTTLNSLKTKSTFEETIKVALQTLTNQVKFLSSRNNNVADNIYKMESGLAHCDQYSRRNTVVVTGLDCKSSEAHDELTENVASEMSKCGLHVVKHDISACHKNSSKHKSVTNSTTGRTISIPPSVTVRFYDSHKKDTVLHKYRNYENNRSKKVRVYQSLNNYYINLKKNISNFCSDNEIDIKWIHWRSQSSGFSIKVSENDDFRVISKVFSMGDFTRHLYK